MEVEVILTVITAIAWFIAGMIFMSIIYINKRKDLLAEKENAEYRAMIHLRTLQKVENILRKDTVNKTPAVLTVEKIKEVLANDSESDN